MFSKEKQAALTYLTWRWIWLIVPMILMFTLGSYLHGFQGKHDDGFLLATMFGLGMPILAGLQWFAGVAKWQFVNPRARLVPGYAKPHIAVLAAVFACLMVINPCLWAAAHGCFLLGPLSYTLLLGGTALWAFQKNQGLYIIPTLLLFFSCMTEFGQHFWIVQAGQYATAHALLLFVGALLNVSWLWRLAHLHEEMDDYQVMPLGGGPASLSRLERSEQKRMMGRNAARPGLANTLSDRWHAKLASKAQSMTALLPYGDSRIPPALQATFAVVACSLYGIFLYKIHLFNADADSPVKSLCLPIMAANGLPGAAAAMLAMQRKPRMAQELLLPWLRKTYLDSLYRSLACRVLMLWLAFQLSLGVVAISAKIFTLANLSSVAVPYAIVSLAIQLPTFGLCMRMARWRSPVGFLFGCYGIILFNMLALAAWWAMRKAMGDMLTVLAVATVLTVLGFAFLRMARRSWQQAELA